MADYSTLKAAIRAVIRENGNEEITGNVLQGALISIINALGAGFTFMGVATPSTNPGTPDYNVAYIGAAGTYINFGGLVIPEGNLGILKLNGDEGWNVELMPGSGGGSVDFVTEPDDLTLDGTLLKFANRNYNQEHPDGLGYKILRKNATFASQVTEANTTYEIRYDFDLGGASFSMPSGCTLRFNGGSIVNGVLNLGGDCVVQGNGIKCGIAEPPAKDTNLSLYLGDTSDSQLNRSVLQEMIDCGAGIIVDTPDLTISDYLEVKTRHSQNQRHHYLQQYSMIQPDYR